MVRSVYTVVLVASLAAAAGGCSTPGKFRTAKLERASAIIEELHSEFAPDSHLAIYRLGVMPDAVGLVVTGDVQSATAKARTMEALQQAGLPAVDRIRVLPQAELGEKAWAIAALATCNGREGTEHKAELGTQLLMGDVVRVWKQTEGWGLNWLYVQSEDGYMAWQSEGNVVRCTEAQAQAWKDSPLLVVTAFETVVYSKPDSSSEPVSDAVLLNKLKRTKDAGQWTEVELPDGRRGFVASADVADYAAWKQSRQATPDRIESTARTLLGRPYLWGANSPRGMDCSGFTKIVFASNGVDLLRNAGHQATQGREVSIDSGYGNLRKGDLLFFGRRASDKVPEKVTHVGIYLGNGQFIHSADRVKISGLDPESPDSDPRHSSRLLKARRILP